RRWQAGLVLAAMIAWPVAHIGNIAPLAVAVNVVLVVAFGSLLWADTEPDAAESPGLAGSGRAVHRRAGDRAAQG
ncbi:MAG TPA: hypothetical protein VLM05_18520, partial [Mycobacteriales bacterium]|nr:hypothetical protein [Mycobacteriales bacterium]